MTPVIITEWGFPTQKEAVEPEEFFACPSFSFFYGGFRAAGGGEEEEEEEERVREREIEPLGMRTISLSHDHVFHDLRYQIG